MSNFCSNCGKEIKEDQNVCLNCGTVIKGNTSDSASGKAVAGLVLGLVSIIAWLLPLIGYPVTICGIVFGAKGLKSTTKKGMATAGLVLSIIFLILTVINSVLGVLINMAYYY